MQQWIQKILCLILLFSAPILLAADGDVATIAYGTSQDVCGKAGDYSLGCIALNLSSGGLVIVELLLAIAFVSGWGFVVAAIFKFKQVRENPTQVPVSTPFAFLLTAILLIFIPGLMSTTAQTVFGTNFVTTQRTLSGDSGDSAGILVGSVTVSEGVYNDTDQNLFAMAYRVRNLFPSLMSLIVGGAYIAGLGFAIVAFTKLKAVKDSPQQNPPTIPLAYLFIAVMLIYIPDIIVPTAETLFGDTGGSVNQESGAIGQGANIILVKDTLV